MPTERNLVTYPMTALQSRTKDAEASEILEVVNRFIKDELERNESVVVKRCVDVAKNAVSRGGVELWIAVECPLPRTGDKYSPLHNILKRFENYLFKHAGVHPVPTFRRVFSYGDDGARNTRDEHARHAH